MSVKIILAAIVLCTSMSWSQAIPPTNGGGQPQQLTIKDPAEYDAYIKTLQMPNSLEKAQALDRFLSQYPNTVVKVEVVKSELLVYQWVKNEDEVVRTAQRLLQYEPTDLRYLALLAYLYQECASRNGLNAKMCADSAVKFGRRGLDVIENVQTPPTGMTPDEYNTLKAQVRSIFQDASRLEQPSSTKANNRTPQ
jgi:hypothetical protein